MASTVVLGGDPGISTGIETPTIDPSPTGTDTPDIEKSRWEDTFHFSAPCELFHPKYMGTSIAAFVVDIVINLHNTIMSYDISKWAKIVVVISMDIFLLLPAAAIAFVESILRLALAIITLPTFLFGWGIIAEKLALSAAHSFAQLPQAGYHMYTTFTAPETIYFVEIHEIFVKEMYCEKVPYEES